MDELAAQEVFDNSSKQLELLVSGMADAVRNGQYGGMEIFSAMMAAHLENGWLDEEDVSLILRMYSAAVVKLVLDRASA